MRKTVTSMFDEYRFSKGAQSIASIMHEALVIKIFLLTKPQVKNMNKKYNDLYYTFVKTLAKGEK